MCEAGPTHGGGNAVHLYCISEHPILADANGKQQSLVWGTESSSASSCVMERSILFPLATRLLMHLIVRGPPSVLVKRFGIAPRMTIHIFESEENV